MVVASHEMVPNQDRNQESEQNGYDGWGGRMAHVSRCSMVGVFVGLFDFPWCDVWIVVLLLCLSSFDGRLIPDVSAFPFFVVFCVSVSIVFWVLAFWCSGVLRCFYCYVVGGSCHSSVFEIVYVI